MKSNRTRIVVEREKTDEFLGLSSFEILELKKKVECFSKKLMPFLKKIDREIEIFLGGSLAKGTVIRKKEKYDVDIFIMFPKKYRGKSGKISEYLEKALKNAKIKYFELNGSRNYYQVMLDNIVLELVPILKIEKANEAQNITDISPLHVKYLLKKIKQNKDLPKEIILAKTFCYAQGVYGAESYIGGFSGYSLEVLVTYFKSFKKLVDFFSKIKITKDKKIIIDPEKHYNNNQQVIDNLNPSKIASPLILIDPVDKTRNVSAALGEEKLRKFIESCKKIKKTKKNLTFFLIQKEKTEDYFIKKAKSNKAEWISLKIKTTKNKLDVAGAKTNKFLDFLIYCLERENFKIIESNRIFNEDDLTAKLDIIIKNPDKIKIVPGPIVNCDKKFIEQFKKKYKRVFIKNKKYYAKTENKFRQFNEFLRYFLKENKETINQMRIKEIKII